MRINKAWKGLLRVSFCFCDRDLIRSVEIFKMRGMDGSVMTIASVVATRSVLRSTKR